MKTVKIKPYIVSTFLPFALSTLVAGTPLVAEEESIAPQREWRKGSSTSDFHRFEQHAFELEGFRCKVVVPKEVAAGTPWIWRARFWGHQPNVDIALLNSGYHVAYADVANLFGSPKAVARWDTFYDYLTRDHGFSKKAALEGMSRGGLIVFNWAARNPEKVACIYADAPVCDFKSWPAGKGAGAGHSETWRQCLKAYEMTEEEALSHQGNPLDNLEPLARAGVPLLHVVGDEDKVVPVAENTAILEERYRTLGGSIEVIHKAGVGHKHGLVDPKPIVDFVLQHTGNESDRGVADFIQPRNGLGNCAHTFTSTSKGRVAFIGGSITEMDGYRPRVGRVLEGMFPKTEFDFINAGISSTGSTTGAFRLATDVLNQGQVDLLFIEFAVNDNQDALKDHNKMTLAMEGMVIQARRHNPNIDIVFLYTTNMEHISDLQSGKTPREIAAHDAVAAHYGIPSVNLAADVAARMAKGEFDWKKFGGVHPAPFGADLYAEDIRTLLAEACRDQGKVPAPLLPAPMEALHYGHGHFVALEKAEFESGWALSKPDWKTLPGATRKQFADIPMLWADQPGATLRLPFSGSAIGMFLVSGPDAGMIDYRIDDGEFQTIDLFTQYSRGLHYPWTCMFASDLNPGAHSLTLRVSERKNAQSIGTAIRIKTFVAN